MYKAHDFSVLIRTLEFKLLSIQSKLTCSLAPRYVRYVLYRNVLEESSKTGDSEVPGSLPNLSLRLPLVRYRPYLLTYICLFRPAKQG